jgi:hypothetical protein
MAPRLAAKYPIEIETASKPREEYTNPEYMKLNLPKAPAVMVGEEVVIEGADMAERKLETAICRNLGLPEPEPKKGGTLSRFFKR